MSSWFLSDIHLKNQNERNSQVLLRFLIKLNKNPSDHRLFLLGDIFDLWVSSGPVFENAFSSLIAQLCEFKNKGGTVYYFEGNHDFHIDVFWTKKLNIPVIENELFLELEGFLVRMEHGDFINPADTQYLNYRKKIRSAPAEVLLHLIPSVVVKFLGEKLSNKSRKKSSAYATEKSESIKNLIRAYVIDKYNEKKFDLIVTGHMHIFDDYEFSVDNKKIRSINLGTWLEKPRVLKLEKKQIEIIDLDKFTSETQ